MRWDPQEDSCITDHVANGTGGLPVVNGRAPNAVRHRKQQLALFQHQAPFPNAIFDAALPPLPLVYDKWTQLSTDYSIPAAAEIDWEYGVARIPEHVQLDLGALDVDIIDAHGESHSSNTCPTVAPLLRHQAQSAVCTDSHDPCGR